MTVPQASVFQGITEEEWLRMGPACSMKWGLMKKAAPSFARVNLLPRWVWFFQEGFALRA